jgi:hypothetical protein
MNAIARWCVIAVVCVSALVGCGGGSDDKAGDEPSSSETSSSPMAAPSSTAPPTYVENESCRTGMKSLIDIILANDTASLDYGTFDNRVDQLVKKVDAAVAPCSPAVNNPIRKAMYKFTLARVQWGIGKCDDACISKVTVNIRAGISLARKVSLQLEATD